MEPGPRVSKPVGRRIREATGYLEDMPQWECKSYVSGCKGQCVFIKWVLDSEEIGRSVARRR